MPTPRPRRARTLALAVGLAFVAGHGPAGVGGSAWAQPQNPVYADDSPAAADALVRLRELVRAGNWGEGVRVVQQMLDDEGDRVVPGATDPDLFVSVRSALHGALLRDPDLLARYRQSEGVRAQQRLDAGDAPGVERSRLLTRAGLVAALRVAQARLESGSFEGARLTLEQLEHHPDRRADAGLGADAARLLAQVARYTLDDAGAPRGEVRARAERWADEAGLDRSALGDAGAAPRPPILGVPVSTPELGGRPTDPAGLLPRPLWSAALGAPDQAGEAVGDSLLRGERLTSEGSLLWVYPSVVGDTVLANNGDSVSAWDRFTLEPRWRTTPPRSARDMLETGVAVRPGFQRGGQALGLQLEDSAGVAVSGRMVIATTGLPVSGAREGDARVHALDAVTGRVLWSAQVSALDRQLDQAFVRGGAVIDGDTVVIAARKAVLMRRIVSVYLVGLELATGKPRWVRLLGTSGSLPYQTRGSASESSLLHRGVVYRADRLGVVGAVEAAGGRTLWVRRLPTEELDSGGARASAWESSRPVIVGDSLVVVAPDGRSLLRLDPGTGAVLGRRSTSVLAQARYVVPVGGWLACVGPERVAFIEGASLETAEPVVTAPAAGGIKGRAVAAGDRLYVPVPGGVLAYDPGAPGTPLLVPLDNPGNVLPLGEQLLVADDGYLHSYLPWTVAERLLQERIEREPGNPGPALTYAELAYRAGRLERIVPAVDAALLAMDRDPLAEAGRAARGRLFRSLLAMLQGSRPEDAGPMARVLEPAFVEELVARLGAAAQTAPERVAYQFELGAAQEARGRVGSAVEAYQAVLLDPQLAAANWHLPRSTIRAELEATSRLARLVASHGAQAYAPFDAAARDELALLAPDADADGFERLARRYPLSGAAPRAWTLAAEAHERREHPARAIDALTSAMAAAEASGDPYLGEAVGRLVRALERADRLTSAAQVLDHVRRKHPGLAISERGTPLDTGSLESSLRERLARLERLPRIGTSLSPGVQSIVGWSIMPSLSRERAGRASEQLMLINAGRGEIALWGVGADRARTDAALEPGALHPLWTRAFDDTPPVLVRQDPDAVYLFWSGAQGGVLERIDSVGGQTRWKSEPIARLIPPDAPLAARLEQAEAGGGEIDTPLDGPARLTDLLVAMDDRTVALVERSGRAAAFDASTGDLLWARILDVPHVYDVDVAAGVVALGGSVPAGGPNGDILGGVAVALALDARSGDELHRLENLDGGLRWVRLTPTGDLVTGLDMQIVCSSPARQRHNWTLADPPVFATLDAWVHEDRLFLVTGDREVYQASLPAGRLSPQPLDLRNKLDGTSGLFMHAAGERVAFCTDLGVAIVDERGRLTGADAIGDTATLLPPVPAEGLFVSVDRRSAQGEDGRPLYTLYLLDARSGLLRGTHQVVALAEPRQLAVLDGRVVLTAGNVTLVLSAPAR